MRKLAQREEQIMHILWQLGQAFVKEIIAEFPAPKPHYNTVSTIVRILEEKGFIGHKAFGNSYQYFPLISKEDYQQQAVGDVLKNYFNGSYQQMVAHFAKEEKISPDDLEEILKMIKKNQ